MVESQVARVGPYHRDAYSGVGYFEPALHNVRSISTIVNHLVTPSQGEYLVRNQPDLVRNFMSAISYVPILHKTVSQIIWWISNVWEIPNELSPSSLHIRT
jgi:hypothetical protein